MDNDWIVFGIPFVIAAVGTVLVLAGEGLDMPFSVTAGGLGIVIVGVLVLAGAIYRLPEPEEAEEAH